MSVTNVYTINPKNIGDLSSTPLLYFTFPGPVRKETIVGGPRSILHDVIFGKGGLTYCSEMNRLCREATGKLVSWGMGHNAHGKTEVSWPSYMSKFALHGVRDWNSPFPWVPCASCMHPVFDAEHKIPHEMVVYEHCDFPIALKEFPKSNNSASSMDEVVKFLGSAEIILTSSYHGAYWGYLLGRKVVVVNPFSTKFRTLRHQPPLCRTENWQCATRDARAFPDALAECRKANQVHHERVCNLIWG